MYSTRTPRRPGRRRPPDWQRGEAGASNGAPQLSHGDKTGPFCKHILAVLIHERIKAETALQSWRQSPWSHRPGNGFDCDLWRAKAAQWREEFEAISHAAQACNDLVAAGESPALAAEVIDAGLMPFEEWRQHHHEVKISVSLRSSASE